MSKESKQKSNVQSPKKPKQASGKRGIDRGIYMQLVETEIPAGGNNLFSFHSEGGIVKIDLKYDSLQIAALYQIRDGGRHRYCNYTYASDWSGAVYCPLKAGDYELHVRNTSKTPRTVAPVLKNFSFELREGETISVDKQMKFYRYVADSDAFYTFTLQQNDQKLNSARGRYYVWLYDEEGESLTQNLSDDRRSIYSCYVPRDTEIYLGIGLCSYRDKSEKIEASFCVDKNPTLYQWMVNGELYEDGSAVELEAGKTHEVKLYVDGEAVPVEEAKLLNSKTNDYFEYPFLHLENAQEYIGSSRYLYGWHDEFQCYLEIYII